MPTRTVLPALLAILATAPTGAQELSLRGDILPMNIGASAGQTVTGTISLNEEGGELRIEIDAGGLAPGMHLAHLHGFAVPDPEEAACPDAAADANGDGIVDLIETRDAAGVTLVPMTENPASLEIMSEGYPEAQEDGQMEYIQIVEPATLERAMVETYGTPPALETRVFFVHGVPSEAGLPDSVQSLEGVPAHATLPIGCAEMKPPL